MAYQALYRTWRPQTFEHVLGQDHICRTLQNAISNRRLAHAYVFSGPRGTGKTSTAKILAKALNCEHGPTPRPCDECSFCVRIREGYCLDVLEMDAASNRGIDEIRSLRDQVRLTPTEARYKVYIIDEVHMLTAEAFNAFLKTLEEPPPKVVFILATTEPERLPATILSRCQRFDFQRLPAEIVAQRLQEVAAEEGLALEPRTAMLLARSAEGSMRDGLGLLDQCISFCGRTIDHDEVLDLLGLPPGEVLTALLGAVGRKDVGAALNMLAQLRAQGKDPRLLQQHLTYWLRNLLLIKVCHQPEPLLALSPNEINDLAAQADSWTKPRLTTALAKLAKQESVLRFSAQPWLVIETVLASLCFTEMEQPAVLAKLSPVKAEPRAAGEPPPVKPVGQPPLPHSGRSEPTAKGVQPEAGDELSLDRIKSSWNQVLATLKSQGPALEALWRYGQPTAIQGKILQVAFEAEGIKKTAERADKVAALERSLKEVMGVQLQVRPQVAAAAVPPVGKDDRLLPAEAPGIREAKTLFGPEKVVILEESEE